MSYLDWLDTYTLKDIYDLVWTSHFDAVMKELNNRLHKYCLYINIVNEYNINQMTIHGIDVYTRFHYVLEQHRCLRESMGWGYKFLRIHYLDLMFELRSRCFERKRRLYYRMLICNEIRLKFFKKTLCDTF